MIESERDRRVATALALGHGPPTGSDLGPRDPGKGRQL